MLESTSIHNASEILTVERSYSDYFASVKRKVSRRSNNVKCRLDLLDSSGCKPFIKWVGGKRSTLPVLLNYIPNYFNK